MLLRKPLTIAKVASSLINYYKYVSAVFLSAPCYFAVLPLNLQPTSYPYNSQAHMLVQFPQNPTDSIQACMIFPDKVGNTVCLDSQLQVGCTRNLHPVGSPATPNLIPVSWLHRIRSFNRNPCVLALMFTEPFPAISSTVRWQQPNLRPVC